MDAKEPNQYTSTDFLLLRQSKVVPTEDNAVREVPADEQRSHRISWMSRTYKLYRVGPVR